MSVNSLRIRKHFRRNVQKRGGHRRLSRYLILPDMSKVLKITPKTIAFDLALVAIVWALFLSIFRSHVPSEDPMIVVLVAGFSALPAAGTFYFCLQMFKVTLAHQRKLKAAKK